MGAESDEETIISAIAAGAKGYLEETASPEQVMQCIDVVESGSIWAPRRVLSVFVDRMLHSSEKPVLRHGFKFTERERARTKTAGRRPDQTGRSPKPSASKRERLRPTLPAS